MISTKIWHKKDYKRKNIEKNNDNLVLGGREHVIYWDKTFSTQWIKNTNADNHDTTQLNNEDYIKPITGNYGHHFKPLKKVSLD